KPSAGRRQQAQRLLSVFMVSAPESGLAGQAGRATDQRQHSGGAGTAGRRKPARTERTDDPSGRALYPAQSRINVATAKASWRATYGAMDAVATLRYAQHGERLYSPHHVSPATTLPGYPSVPRQARQPATNWPRP